jgi:hypothetical protein
MQAQPYEGGLLEGALFKKRVAPFMFFGCYTIFGASLY